ncbi:hypothetical protein D9V84_08850 [Bacteroidetes/Chlorobi group bacterium Naka2016]|jgi:membrane-associated phospholipid phosphatase|nr:MAG: hypothetical protein D9V84_08850 [Bacteroidetes/Chlorobi group bacterium Naka2016]
MNGMETLKENWKNYLSSRQNVLLLIISFALMVISLHFVAKFITGIENRQGFAFDDPFLGLFKGTDLSWLIFSVLYFSVFFTFFQLLQTPQDLVLGFFAYSMLISFRVLCMYLLPLDPPKDIVLLKDPIIESFGTEITLTRDLFFSGHTSLMVLLFLLVKKKYAKIFLFFATMIVALGVLLQKAHYSVDVVVAVFASYCAYSWTKGILTYVNFIKK